MDIRQTTEFKKQVKKLHKNQKKDLDAAILVVVKDVSIGDIKTSDLKGIQVYKFKMAKQLTLLTYKFYADQVVLIFIALGSHENFYRNLKR